MNDRFEMQEYLIEYLGVDGAFDAVVRAMSDDAMKDLFDFIVRSYDIEDDELNENARFSKDINDFVPAEGAARETWETLRANDKLEAFKDWLEEEHPEAIDEQELNHMLANDAFDIYKRFGINLNEAALADDRVLSRDEVEEAYEEMRAIFPEDDDIIKENANHTTYFWRVNADAISYEEFVQYLDSTHQDIADEDLNDVLSDFFYNNIYVSDASGQNLYANERLTLARIDYDPNLDEIVTEEEMNDWLATNIEVDDDDIDWTENPDEYGYLDEDPDSEENYED